MKKSNQAHRGFTLVELLVVISIIAVLSGLGLWAVMRARIRAQEFAMEQANSQIAQSLEAFRTKYGFYPPNIDTVTAAGNPKPGFVTNANDFIPYLNQIAPNHGELEIVGGQRRIDYWWDQVGRFLNPETSLAFWLSGLGKNKQFPLTYIDGGGAVVGLPAYNYTPPGVVAEREVFHEFKTLMKWRTGTGSPIENIGVGATPFPNVAVVSQTAGRYEPIVYYSINNMPNPLPNDANGLLDSSTNVHRWTVYLAEGGVDIGPYWYYDNALGSTQYLALEKFQIFSPGVDAIFSSTAFSSGNAAGLLSNPRERDNISNFSEGRLERLTVQ